jgi:excisionase family DNA binding protein
MIKQLISTSEKPDGVLHNRDWSDELKAILGKLVDLAANVVVADARKLTLNEIVTPDELAQRFKVPVSTIEELARKGKIPGAFRIGKHWRFDMDAVRIGLPNLGPESVDR